jgi:aquaporin Z
LSAEFLGTFLFLSVILAVTKDPKTEPVAIAIVSGLLSAIYAFGGLSGGHFNPAVSVMFFAKGDLPVENFGPYIVAQSLGGLAALYFFKAAHPSPAAPTPLPAKEAAKVPSK